MSFSCCVRLKLPKMVQQKNTWTLGVRPTNLYLYLESVPSGIVWDYLYRCTHSCTCRPKNAKNGTFTRQTLESTDFKLEMHKHCTLELAWAWSHLATPLPLCFWLKPFVHMFAYLFVYTLSESTIIEETYSQTRCILARDCF